MNSYLATLRTRIILPTPPTGLLPALLLLCFCSQPTLAQTTDANVGKAISALLESKRNPLLSKADFSGQAKNVARLYQFNAMRPVWLGIGDHEKNLNDGLAVLLNSAADGLEPSTYDAEELDRALRQLKSQPEPDPRALAAQDVAMSISMLRYLHDLHYGRIDPREFNYPRPYGLKPAIDLAGVLQKHLDMQAIADLPDELAPQLKQYKQLKQALAEFRQQAQMTQPPPLTLQKSLHPGETDPDFPALRLRLRDLGYLRPEDYSGAADAEIQYDESSAAALARFQEDQGLQADGVIGKQTLALLNRTPEQKIALIELSMERLRWLPELPEGRQILVNIPAFQLWALNSREDDNALNMRVIVGKAKENQTPILWEHMEYLEFMPYWNIPKSILDKEIMPKIHSNGGYLASQNIELIERPAPPSQQPPPPPALAEGEQAADAVTVPAAEPVKRVWFRARQRPGNKNPLGRVKFIFPNNEDVYMHDTPMHGAFNRDRRDLSHGCVRVSEPEKLAEFVLENQEGWDRQSIEQAMAGSKTQRVSLRKSIPVLFFYNTAFAGQDNKLRFYQDIYGYDLQLREALQHKPEKPALVPKKPAADG